MLKKSSTMIFIVLFLVSRGNAANIPVVPQISDAPVASKVALLHFNPKLKDLRENLKRIKALIITALTDGANFIVTPELATSGYAITENDVKTEVGIAAPFNELDDIKALARKFSAYIVIGVAEKDVAGDIYNSAVILGPDGAFRVVRKRGLSGFNKRGNLPFLVLNTKFGDVGVVICSDMYLMDISRELALQGADLVLSPANWWGSMNQLDIWGTRAHENSFYLLVANRWGKETDSRFPPNSYVYDMNDAPSAAISPEGKILMSYQARDEATPHDKVLFQEVVIPKSRIGTKINPAWSLNYRKPALYTDIANDFYRPDKGNVPPQLPSPGILNVAVLAFAPEVDVNKNKELLQSSLQKCQSGKADVLVLPANAYKNEVLTESEAIDMGNYLGSLVKEKKLKAVVASYSVSKGGCTSTNTLVVQQGMRFTAPGLHPYPPSRCTESQPPLSFDLEGVRLGIPVDRDIVMPEVAMALAKRGTDAILSSTSLGGEASTSDEFSGEDYLRLIKTATNNGLHVASSSSKGFGAIVTSEYGSIKDQIVSIQPGTCISTEINAAGVRTKYLNALQDSDLSTLLDNFHLLPSRSPQVATEDCAGGQQSLGCR